MSDPDKPVAPDWVRVYQSSRYAFVSGGVWREFALDGEEAPLAGLQESVTLITAWNPDSEEHPQPWNWAANARLLRAIVSANQPWAPAWGGSLPDVEPAWREEGFVLFGLDRSRASRWGAEWGQRALVWLDSEASELLFVAEERSVSCGLRRFGAH